MSALHLIADIGVWATVVCLVGTALVMASLFVMESPPLAALMLGSVVGICLAGRALLLTVDWVFS